MVYIVQFSHLIHFCSKTTSFVWDGFCWQAACGLFVGIITLENHSLCCQSQYHWAMMGLFVTECGKQVVYSFPANMQVALYTKMFDLTAICKLKHNVVKCRLQLMYISWNTVYLYVHASANDNYRYNNCRYFYGSVGLFKFVHKSLYV